jgi:DNA-binding beta-propeller fold protein YncE
MKRFALALVFFMAAPLALFAQMAAPEIPFDADVNPVHLPKDMYLGEVAGVAVNAAGHIFVFSRGNTTGPAYGASAAQLLEFGPDGTYIREIGHNLYGWSYAHGVRIDKEQNIWVSDKGSDVVVKFNPAGRVTMVLGRKQEASAEEVGPLKHPKPPLPPINGYFRQVTDMAWNAAGETFISDGYLNSRVAKYDKDGNFMKSFGEPGEGPGQLDTPHSIAVDPQGNVYVANRGNMRIEVYDSDGKYLRQIKIHEPFDYANSMPVIGNKVSMDFKGSAGPYSPWAVCITPGPNPVLYTADTFPGRVYKLSLDGKVLGMLGKAGRQPKEFGWIHAIACPSENTLYVAELLNWRVQKLTLHPKK